MRFLSVQFSRIEFPSGQINRLHLSPRITRHPIRMPIKIALLTSVPGSPPERDSAEERWFPLFQSTSHHHCHYSSPHQILPSATVWTQSPLYLRSVHGMTANNFKSMTWLQQGSIQSEDEVEGAMKPKKTKVCTSEFNISTKTRLHTLRYITGVGVGVYGVWDDLRKPNEMQ